MDAGDREYQRLRWRCRRGMLELDLILEGFLERRYAVLSADDRARFSRLLETPDEELYLYLHGRAQSADPEIRKIIKLIV